MLQLFYAAKGLYCVMLEGRAAQEYTKELKKSQYFFQPVSDIETTITGAFHFHDAQMSYY